MLMQLKKTNLSTINILCRRLYICCGSCHLLISVQHANYSIVQVLTVPCQFIFQMHIFPAPSDDLEFAVCECSCIKDHSLQDLRPRQCSTTMAQGTNAAGWSDL